MADNIRAWNKIINFKFTVQDVLAFKDRFDNAERVEAFKALCLQAIAANLEWQNNLLAQLIDTVARLK